MKIAVIIVTYASERVLPLCLEALARQTRQPDRVVIVDNRSPDPGYLDDIPTRGSYRVIRSSVNAGFSAGNNLGYLAARDCDYILFLNPDAFPEPRFIAEAERRMERQSEAMTGALTGTLLGFDLALGLPSGRIDSTGIFQTWYGRWYDRAQGRTWRPEASRSEPEPLPAICAASMFCRTRALEAVALADAKVFDERFFMYKEDIELSLRLRRHGWRLVYEPDLLCYHARGWQGRRAMSARAKLMSARNDLRVALTHRARGLPYSLLKYAYVAAVESRFARR